MNKKTLITTLQVLATVGILTLLFRDPAKDRQMWEALAHANLSWIGLALILFGAVEACAVARWQILLRVQGVTVSWLRLSALLMIGLFFNPLMPGGTGGDVAKIFYLLKEVPRKKPAALLAVLMDRIIGMVAVMFVAGVVITIRYHWLMQTKATSALLYTLLAIFGGSVFFIGSSYFLTLSGLVHKLPARLPLRDKLLDMAAAYNQYGRAWRSTLAAFALSLPVHMGSFTVSYCAAKAFSEAAVKARLLDFWAIMPIVNTISCIPLSIGGTGVREGLFVTLLGDLLGISVATALMVSLAFFMVQVLWGLAGGVIYWFYRPSTHARMREIKTEVAALGHEIADTEQAS